MCSSKLPGRPLWRGLRERGEVYKRAAQVLKAAAGNSRVRAKPRSQRQGIPRICYLFECECRGNASGDSAPVADSKPDTPGNPQRSSCCYGASPKCSQKPSRKNTSHNSRRWLLLTRTPVRPPSFAQPQTCPQAEEITFKFVKNFAHMLPKSVTVTANLA
jgi:hypothetical protein